MITRLRLCDAESERKPTLSFEFVRALLKLRANTPAFAALFQFPTAIGHTSRRLPWCYAELLLAASRVFSFLIQPPINLPYSSTIVVSASYRS